MSAIKDGETFALLCFMGGGCLNALRKAKMSKSPDAYCLFSLKAEKKLTSSNLYKTQFLQGEPLSCELCLFYKALDPSI